MVNILLYANILLMIMVIIRLMMVNNNLIGGWAYPSEKYDNSSVGIIIPNWMESRKIHVPNHQPEPVQASWQCLLSQAFLLIAWKIRVNLRPVMTSMASLTENGLGTLQIDPDRWISPDH